MAFDPSVHRHYLAQEFDILQDPGRYKLLRVLGVLLIQNTHPGLLPVAAAYFDPDALSVVVLYEEMQQDMRELVQCLGSMPEPLIAYTLVAIVESLATLHAAGLVHNGVATYEVYSDMTGRIRLGGYALWSDKNKGVISSDDPELDIGHYGDDVTFMPPERLLQYEATPFSDMWALGLVAIELAAARHAYATDSLELSLVAEDVEARIKRTHAFKGLVVRSEAPTIPAKLWRRFSPALHDLIARCTSKVPEHRPFPQALLTHELLTSYPEAGPSEMLAWIGGTLNTA
eukprot:CAMPEP_0206218902 /NCGR_PEP_ID=MMETSP0047_2-20121206/4039_1 /ASSEMBLY_ACC=CAM_ASM_000192 /TAXON_ID=195065 /ORGANISM="Chroomonas mesostigmatica_cf, Strain CCMP1168" /LENGTH=286 /DNA_ID=CAMNT_0053641421 /DNA_START=35 /DNA_END=891 /DNA_ORIENTATION=+